MLTDIDAQHILDSAELIHSAESVFGAMDRLAGEIARDLAGTHPLLLSVMGGAVVFTGHLLTRLRFPLDFDYVHVSRYGDATQGGELRWVAAPHEPIEGRTVLVLDDILDEGVTLAAIRRRVLELGAARCLTAVFADKQLGRAKPVTPDYVGLQVPNRYVFGFGMDVSGKWRNLPEIYALRGS